MGSMSASDAAPLPRLGEVFFDVRGESRSMRLSWYAGTGVAVFSIWQGGTCTGTFRLPITELPRMVAALRQGPPAAAGHGDGRARQRQPSPDPGAVQAGGVPDWDAEMAGFGEDQPPWGAEPTGWGRHPAAAGAGPGDPFGEPVEFGGPMGEPVEFGAGGGETAAGPAAGAISVPMAQDPIAPGTTTAGPLAARLSGGRPEPPSGLGQPPRRAARRGAGTDTRGGRPDPGLPPPASRRPRQDPGTTHSSGPLPAGADPGMVAGAGGAYPGAPLTGERGAGGTYRGGSQAAGPGPGIRGTYRDRPLAAGPGPDGTAGGGTYPRDPLTGERGPEMAAGGGTYSGGPGPGVAAGGGTYPRDPLTGERGPQMAAGGGTYSGSPLTGGPVPGVAAGPGRSYSGGPPAGRPGPGGYPGSGRLPDAGRGRRAREPGRAPADDDVATNPWQQDPLHEHRAEPASPAGAGGAAAGRRRPYPGPAGLTPQDEGAYGARTGRGGRRQPAPTGGADHPHESDPRAAYPRDVLADSYPSVPPGEEPPAHYAGAGQPRRRRDGGARNEESEPSPDSFPYGALSDSRTPQQPGGYPGRH
jgi:hypothetical protein